MAEKKSRFVRWLSLIKKYSPDDAQTQAQSGTSAGETEQNCPADVPGETEEMPLEEATARELEYWHSYGGNVFLQTLHRRYALDYANPAAYSHFKIGYDPKRHVATFAVDATHYYIIKFDQFDAQPINHNDANRVLEKISELRRARSYRKDFCGVMIESFDAV